MEVNKQTIIKQFKLHSNDTGSSEVQIAILTYRINYLSEYLKKSKKDNSTKVGFFKMIGKRRRFLNYLKKNNKDKYSSLIKKLNLRK
ncbi:MAG: 30S ribosomal protein S15 [Endomicrobium sp.]|jgi:small subunit ribosomal protein S15|nr:30S ribosomal protein S15 [Endomicrobium sp.]